MKKYTITLECDENIDSGLFKVYLDMKKKLYIKKEPLPNTLTELDCDCKAKIKYSVN